MSNRARHATVDQATHGPPLASETRHLDYRALGVRRQLEWRGGNREVVDSASNPAIDLLLLMLLKRAQHERALGRQVRWQSYLATEQ